MVKIAIDRKRCTMDGMCSVVCPVDIFVQRERATVPELVGEERCISCGHCMAICPSGAISHSAFPPGSVSPIEFDKIPSPEQVTELLKTRRSIRAFQEKPLAKETLEEIIDGARSAPSAHNAQSTEYLVVLDGAVLSQVSAVTIEYLRFEVGRLNNLFLKTLLSLVDRELLELGLREIPGFERIIRKFEAGQDPILHRAPALLVFHARRNLDFGVADAHLALQNASLLAHSMGVGHFFTGYVLAACRVPMSRAWSRRIPDLIGIPAENEIHGALALGYPVPKFKKWIERKPARIQWV
jgi:nitroreductase/NAD-dependent dihydropyrimidine dehydrogenase PreA subunit